MKTEIYTDGSSIGNPGPGGWGVVLINKVKSIKDGSSDASLEVFREKIIKEIGGSEKNTTNNRMELTATIEALKYCRQKNLKSVTLFTDSAYVLNGITTWIFKWQKNNWKTADKKPVLNQDLWQELFFLNQDLKNNISWQKIKGHSGHIHNDRADLIATRNALLQK
jgi:ribonuclease HI